MASSKQPDYIHIANSIIQSIERGEYAPDGHLPTQRELCQKYKTSLMTMRRVLNDLTREGIIRSIPGKGIYINPKAKPSDYGSLEGFEPQMARLGLKPLTETLEAKTIVATTFLSGILKVREGSQVVYLFRLRYADGNPFSIYKAYIPHHLCPGILGKGLANGSLFNILRKEYGHRLVGSRNTASAVLPDAEAMRLLSLAEPVAMLLREQITFIDSGEIIEYSRNLTRGDLYCVQYDEGQVF
jgi:GntR family transcriptional regulator